MASGGIDYTTCSICLGPFDAPRMLPCGHSFCTTCLQSLIDRDTRKCPDCRKVFPNRLSQSFPINYAAIRPAENAESDSSMVNYSFK
ncbi:tripartite motif-containing protein 59-like [Convolutriloba macropyga]|uniref:tripartite motif-containing protein 59-like n=1 Tax=Convolutriloba macropyga TaxID=536237 RepID=UPI003F528BF1